VTEQAPSGGSGQVGRDADPARSRLAAAQVQVSGEYRTLFDEVEQWLRVRCGVSTATPFGTLLAHSKAGPAKRFHRQLINHAEIRNVMAHGHLGGQPPVAPTLATLEEIRSVHAALVGPPPVLSVLPRRPVVTCAPEQPLMQALSAMTRDQLDQLPVVIGRRTVGLLTSVAVARWLGQRLGTDGGVLSEVEVGEVMGFEAPDHCYAFAKRSATTLHVLEMFEKAMLAGETLDAVLVSETGAAPETLLGIVVPYDLPALAAHV
jgi:CBS domain-containing protein